MIRLKRVYDETQLEDGERFLVDRLWPRGIAKGALHMESWLREAGPSTVLRKWFGHDPKKWEEFKREYVVELESRPGAWEPLIRAAAKGTVTLLFASSDREHNNAVVLKSFLDRKLQGPTI